MEPSSYSMHAAAFLKHPRTPTGVTGMDYQSADSEHLIKRIRTGPSEEVRKRTFMYFLSPSLIIMPCIYCKYVMVIILVECALPS